MLDPGAEALLTGPRRPVVLLPRRGAPLAPSVAPGNPDLGVLLAYTPLHPCCSGCPATPPARGAGDDLRQPRRRADRLPTTTTRWSGWRRSPTRGCGTTGPSTCRATTPSSGSSTARSCPYAARAGTHRCPSPCRSPVPATLAVGADLKNTCAGGRGPLRLAEPARRGHGRPRHAAGLRRDGCAPVRPDPGRARPSWRPTRTPATAPQPGPAAEPGPARCAPSSTTTRTSPR